MLKLFIIVICAVVAMAMPNVDGDVRPTPAYCLILPSDGSGRATHPRYRYRAETNECEFFRWGGGVAEENVFISKDECERTCRREDSGVEERIGELTCEFSSNLGRLCSLGAILGPNDIGFCMNQEDANMTRDQCALFGCCWHLGLCFQRKSDLVKSSCTIHRSSPTRFWGKIVFQSDTDVANWLGSIRFNSAIAGDFCIVEGDLDYVEIDSESLEGRRQFTLPSRKELSAGEQVSMLFVGRLDGSPLDGSICSAINRRNRNRPGK